jgi:hypothetical protein
LILLASCSSRKVHLRFVFEKNQVLHYAFALSSEAEVTDSLKTGHYSSSANLLLSQQINQVYENGDTRCIISVDSVGFQTDYLSEPEVNNIVELLKRTALALKISPYGDFLEMEGEEDLPQVEMEGMNLSRLLLKIQPVLPHSGIAIGSVWEREQQFPVRNSLNSGTLYLRKNFQLLELKNYKGRLCARISFKIVANIGMKESEKSFQASAPKGQSWVGKGNGILYFDMQKNCFLEGSAEMTTQMETTVLDPLTKKLQHFPVKMQQRFTMNLVE